MVNVLLQASALESSVWLLCLTSSKILLTSRGSDLHVETTVNIVFQINFCTVQKH